MSDGIPRDAVIVSDRKMQSDDPYDLVWSNVSYLNSQFEEHLLPEEVAPDSLRSYYVDYYRAEIENGGFSQFVYNCGWDPRVVTYVREGLDAMAATGHRALFDEAAALVDALGEVRLIAFLESGYFGENEERDALGGFDERFFELCEEEDLIELNAGWLRALPNLVVLPVEEMRAELDRRVAAIPNREERVAEALANEPRYMHLVRALCEEAGHELREVTSGDPDHEFDGVSVLAWHFLTDQGHFALLDLGNRALMIEPDSGDVVLEMGIEETDEEE